MIIFFYLSIIFLLSSVNLFATSQYGDRLIIEKDTIWINSNPLEFYFNQKGSRTINTANLSSGCTALWRGYIATWKLENNNLYLVRLQTDYCNTPKDIDLTKEFGSDKVFAKWYSETMIRPNGALLCYIHMGYNSIYEEDIYYKFKNGKLVKTDNKKYLEYDNKLMFPGETFLRNTIKNMILKSIDTKTREVLNEKQSCSIQVHFGKDRKISKITVGYREKPKNELEKIILEKSVDTLRNFPQLMKVTHEGYKPPTIILFFNAHCLKYPKDSVYGCKDE